MPIQVNDTVFAPFAEIRKNDDGSRTVFGLVTDEAVDADSQIADLGWARKEMASWSKWSNIRAMHKAEAVGVGTSLEDKGDGIYLEAKIVDADAVRKIDEGVYKGYSIGIKGLPGNPYRVNKDAAAKNGRIVGGAIVEVSIVDRPAHPDAAFSVVKNVEALDKEVADIATLTQAAEMIRSVYSPPAEAPVQTADEVDKGVGLSVHADTYSSALTLEDALKECLSALGLGQGAETSEGKTVKVEPPVEEEVVDKAQVAEVIKSMTSEERSELGIVSQEELESLKTSMAEQAALIETLGKTIVPTGIHGGGAISTQPVSTEVRELEQELEAMKTVHETASSTGMRQWAGLKVQEITKAIAAQAVTAE